MTLFRLIIVFLFASLAAHAQVTPVIKDGKKYVRLDDLADFYGGRMEPTPGGEVKIKTRWAEIEVTPGERLAKIGGTIVWLHAPVQRVNWHWAIRHEDALSLIDPIMRPSEYLDEGRPRVVVLDPGHGGQDPGALGDRGSKEKYGALDIARRVRRHLVAAGMKVHMTRENDRFIGLEARPEKARKLHADLFVSIHLNSSREKSASGIETFILPARGMPSYAGNVSSSTGKGDAFGAQNALLGFHIHRSLTRESSAIDRGLKAARFIVLMHAPCPAVLIECGFLSHGSEEQNLMREDYREELARNIARGIMVYTGLAKRAERYRDEQ